MTYRFATAENPLLPMKRARVFFDGIFSDPRLQHPEGVAAGPDGWIWCGSEVLRIDPAGVRIERVAAAGGFTLGLAFFGDQALFLRSQGKCGVPARSRLSPGRTVHPTRHQNSELSGYRCCPQSVAGF